MANKSKILFVITSDEYIRNYIETDVLNVIEKNHEIKFIVDDTVSKKKQIKQNQLILSYQSNTEQDKKLNDLFDILMYQNLNKSSSFYFRFLRYKQSKNITLIKTFYYFLLNLIKRNKSFFKYYFKSDLIKFKSSKVFNNYFVNRIIKHHKINPQICNVFEEYRPDLVIFPSSAYEPISYDLIELSNLYRCKTFFIIDNWDNLSSKTILFKKPNYLGVWSEQAKQHAIDIQDFDANNIKIIGSARFHNYFFLKNQNIKSHFNFKYILFIGTTLEYDEFDVLQRLNNIIKTTNNLNNLKIIYRPHPWRQSSNNKNLDILENVKIDPQVENNYNNNSKGLRFQPDLNYYPSLISNAEFLIGGLSSMIIESLIFNKKYIALVHDDKKNVTNQKNALKYFTHFKGIENLENLFLCEDLNKLNSLFNDFITNQISYGVKSNQINLDYFIYGSENTTYNDILSESINQILDEK